MKNKAELTTQQIVGLIILIVSFTIILILIFRLNLGETTDKEICHNSVMMKAKSVLKSGPLDCKTTYVCISGGRECEQFSPTTTIDIDMNQEPEKVKNDTMKAIADEMADCWWMFGEGEIDYVSKGIVFDKAACSTCSIISFDNKIFDKFEKGINYNEFYEYLMKTKKDNSKSYLTYLYKTNDITLVEKDFNKFLNNYFSNNIELDKQYFILTGRFEDAIFSFFINDKSIGVTILKKTKNNYEEIGCDVFLTRA